MLGAFRLLSVFLLALLVAGCGNGSSGNRESAVENVVRMYVDSLESGDADGVEALLAPGVDGGKDIDERLKRFNEREVRQISMDTSFEFGGQVARVDLLVDFASGPAYREQVMLVEEDSTFYVSLGEATQGNRTPSSIIRPTDDGFQ